MNVSDRPSHIETIFSTESEDSALSSTGKSIISACPPHNGIGLHALRTRNEARHLARCPETIRPFFEGYSVIRWSKWRVLLVQKKRCFTTIPAEETAMGHEWIHKMFRGRSRQGNVENLL